MFSLVGLLAVLFFVFIYLFPWIETDSGKAIGFAYVALDLLGYRTGSMNEPEKTACNWQERTEPKSIICQEM